MKHALWAALIGAVAAIVVVVGYVEYVQVR